MSEKTTIAELEALLVRGVDLEILPDGSLRAGEEVTAAEQSFEGLLTYREQLGGNY